MDFCDKLSYMVFRVQRNIQIKKYIQVNIEHATKISRYAEILHKISLTKCFV